MGKSRRKGWYEDFCTLPILVPKECLPLLAELKEKLQGCAREHLKAKGFIMLAALELLDQQTPHGFWWGGEGRLKICDPPEETKTPRRHLRLVSPTTSQEKGIKPWADRNES
ncbi:MAG: hypothetical protein R3B74_11930 [Nitrospirales bacterium]|nr:hypothetical protein [Nitrospirales bacterium]